jgi:hypothetical protein
MYGWIWVGGECDPNKCDISANYACIFSKIYLHKVHCVYIEGKKYEDATSMECINFGLKGVTHFTCIAGYG